MKAPLFFSTANPAQAKMKLRPQASPANLPTRHSGVAGANLRRIKYHISNSHPLTR